MSNSEQSQWIVAIKDSILEQQSKDEDEQPVFVKLRHPKTGEDCMCMFTNKNKQVYEVLAFQEKYRSWIIGQSIQQDGSLYMTTPIDPVFLVLPYLVKSSKSGKYMTLDQIVTDENYHECHRLHDCSGISQLDQVADVKGDEDFKAYRYNKEKTLSWLKQKVERLSKVLEQKKVYVAGGSQAASYVKSSKFDDASEEDYTRYAHGMVSDYLNDELGTELKNSLGLKDVVDKAKIQEPPKKKIKTEKGAPVEDYSVNNSHLQAKDTKPTKMTVGQRKLAKVDKTGMKSISSFFSPKAKK